MASSGECYLDTQQLCDYVLLRHVNVSKDAESEKLYRVSVYNNSVQNNLPTSFCIRIIEFIEELISMEWL